MLCVVQCLADLRLPPLCVHSWSPYRQFTKLTKWLRAFVAEVGTHEAARNHALVVDGALMAWIRGGVAVRNKVRASLGSEALAVVDLRCMHCAWHPAARLRVLHVQRA